MRIAQVAPLHESVPPKGYGGTERVVSHLTEDLVRHGHQVTLFASADSVTAAELVPVIPTALRGSTDWPDAAAPHVLSMELVAAQAHRFDIIHFHVDSLSLAYARRIGVPSLLTLHGRLDIPGLVPYFREFAEANVVSISDAQRAPLPWLNWLATVHHGLPPGQLRFNATPEGYLAFVGRLSPEKRCDRAIEMARRTGLRLRIAAKVDGVDRDYFEREIEPLLDDPLVEFVGEVGEEAKAEFLGNALALAFPIDWPEPFGLVMIEAMATGTPVIAFGTGSVPEVVDDGVTGRIVHDMDGAVQALDEIGALSRHQVRERFVERFGACRMARDYVAAYERLIEVRQERAASFLHVVPPMRPLLHGDVADSTPARLTVPSQTSDGPMLRSMPTDVRHDGIERGASADRP